MDGYRCVEFLRSQGVAIPIVAVTGLDASKADTEQRCFQVGMNGCVFKPLTLPKLTNLLNERSIQILSSS